MIVVTGGTGLVGSHLLQHLLALGLGPLRAIYRTRHPEIEGVQWMQADLTQVLSLEEAFAGAEQVYHCAALVSFAPADAAALHEHNVVGTENVVNACLATGVKRLCYVSSVAALARIRKDGKPVHEGMNWTAETSNSVYGKTKYLAEREVWRGQAEGLSCVVVNPSIILGNSSWDSGSMKIFKSAYEEFGWFTTGTSGFVDVLDLVAAMVALMQAGVQGERFIVSGHNVSYQHLFNLAADAFGKRRPWRRVTPFLAGLIWRAEAVKSLFTGSKPLITKETAHTSLNHVQYDVGKLLKALPAFGFRPLKETVERVAEELRERYGLVR